MQTFSTDLISPFDRLAYWNEVVCKTYLVVGCDSLAGSEIAGHLQVRKLGDIEVSDVVSPPMAYRRTERDLRTHHEEHYQLVLLTDGRGIVQQDGREAVLAPGDITLYSASRPSVVSLPEGARTTVFKIPRDVMSRRSDNSDKLTAIKLLGGNPMAAMVGSLMRQAIALEACPTPALDAKFASGLLDIVGVALDTFAGVGADDNPFRHGQLKRIKSYILDHLADSGIHMEGIAARNNISVRTLNRLFADDGTTAFKWLWDQRLAASYKMLSEGRVRQVSEAAFSCGFNDLSHFSKAFKKRFGTTPLQLLGAVRKPH